MKLPIQHRIIVNGVWWPMSDHILDACRIGDLVLVISDYHSQAQQPRGNLRAYDLNHKIHWVAEHPTTNNNDVYVRFVSELPLRVSNFAGYTCEIDIKTGKLREAIFTK